MTLDGTSDTILDTVCSKVLPRVEQHLPTKQRILSTGNPASQCANLVHPCTFVIVTNFYSAVPEGTRSQSYCTAPWYASGRAGGSVGDCHQRPQPDAIEEVNAHLPDSHLKADLDVAASPPHNIHDTMRGAKITAVIDISLIRMFRLGPDVSLNGSPTVSPMTAALCGSERFPPK
jgi:hypothetical protein